MIHPNSAMRRPIELRQRHRLRDRLRLLADGARAWSLGVIASGSTLRWMIAGLPEACAALKAAAKSAVFSTVDAEAAERRA